MFITLKNNIRCWTSSKENRPKHFYDILRNSPKTNNRMKLLGQVNAHKSVYQQAVHCSTLYFLIHQQTRVTLSEHPEFQRHMMNPFTFVVMTEVLTEAATVLSAPLI